MWPANHGNAIMFRECTIPMDATWRDVKEVIQKLLEIKGFIPPGDEGWTAKFWQKTIDDSWINAKITEFGFIPQEPSRSWIHVIMPMRRPYADLPGNAVILLSDSGTDDERMLNDSRMNRRVESGKSTPPGNAPIAPPPVTTPLPSTTIDRSPSPATDVSGPTSHVTNSEMSVVVTMIDRLERRMAAMESPSGPASSSIAAPVPQP